jgi:putative transposase
MRHSYVTCLVHYVFSTTARRPLITSPMKERLWAYIGGTARRKGMKALAVGGTEDHIHALVSIPSTISVAVGIQVIKANSSKWVHDSFPSASDFAWQAGYGAFSLSVSLVPNTIEYIRNQETHHKARSFEQEFLSFLVKHGIRHLDRENWE